VAAWRRGTERVIPSQTFRIFPDRGQLPTLGRHEQAQKPTGLRFPNLGSCKDEHGAINPGAVGSNPAGGRQFSRKLIGLFGPPASAFESQATRLWQSFGCRALSARVSSVFVYVRWLRSLVTAFSTAVPLKKSGFIPAHSLAGLRNVKSQKLSTVIISLSTSS
jgi:hypothetical protein